MKTPEITITLTLTNTFNSHPWNIQIGEESFEMDSKGGTIETMSYGRYFFDTPYYGVTDTQAIYKLSDPLDHKFTEII